MLVLSRQRDEIIMIGDDVEITIVDIRGDKVRIGITAPAHIPVHRKEVYEAIKRENYAASKIKPEDLDSVADDGSKTSQSGTDKKVPQAPKSGRPKRRGSVAGKSGTGNNGHAKDMTSGESPSVEE